MKLATFTHGGATRIGLVEGDEIVDLSAAAPDLPSEMVAFLEAGDPALEAARGASGTKLALDDVHLESPILRPPKILAVGVNYRDHVEEAKDAGMKVPEHPMVFNKQATSAHPPFEPFHLPRASAVLDYEGELGFVIGRRCRHVSRDDAPDCIAGYLVVNDVSVRDWQLRTPTWTMGKSFDTHGPIGPWIVTGDELPDPHQLRLRTWVNDELRQDSNTKELIFDCFRLVEHFSTAFTLEPGDVVATGTPAGVGIGMKPPKLLVAGDEMRVEIEGIGELTNTVIEEPAEAAGIF